MPRRAVIHSFVYVAVNDGHPEWGPGVRAHYYPDCDRITANGCHAELLAGAARSTDRPLCFTCVSRLVAEAEAHRAADESRVRVN
jgi:hypothetical protein